MPTNQKRRTDSGRGRIEGPTMERTAYASIPRVPGGKSIIGAFEITKIRNNHFAARHLKTARQFYIWSNGTTHVWEADEMIPDKKGGFKRSTTACTSYQSLTDMCRRVLARYVQRDVDAKEVVAKRAEDMRQAKLMQKLGKTIILVEEKPEGPQAEYHILVEDQERIVFGGPGGKDDRYAVKFLTPLPPDTPGHDRWCIFKLGETRPLGFGFDTSREAIAELSYLLLATDFKMQWAYTPHLVCTVTERSDGTFTICWCMTNGVVESDEVYLTGEDMLWQLAIDFQFYASVENEAEGAGQGVGTRDTEVVLVCRNEMRTLREIKEMVTPLAERMNVAIKTGSEAAS